MIPIVILLLLTAPRQQPDARALALVDSAIARIGGPALTSVERLKLEMLTQWQRTSFDARPYHDYPSYERHSELRDYTLPAWRNTRSQLTGGIPIVDVVTDSVSIRIVRGTPAPLSIAYVDERNELFTFSPDRVLLAARAARDLRQLPDTSIGGVAHARVSATLKRYPATLFFRKSDGLPALVYYRAAQPNDFGLTPYGEMDVEIWYSRWQTLPPGVSLPLQWDVQRAGAPYKRMTVLTATINPPAMPDSFVVTDSLRRAFAATATRPMHDVPLDSARVQDERFALFGAFGYPLGAVKLGQQWLLFEAGQAPLNLERAVAWLKKTDPASSIAGVITSLPAGASGGATWAARQRIPVYTGAGAQPFVRTILKNAGQSASTLVTIERGRWQRIGRDSLWLETFDLPNARGTLIAYVPSLAWVYAPTATGPLEQRLLLAHAQQRGWNVERIGTARGFLTPLRAGAQH